MKFLIVICWCFTSISVIFGKNVRIINGKNANIKNYPYMAAFRYTIPNLLFCGGAIISNLHILTAAHCLFNDERRYHIIRIYTGISDTFSTSGPTHEIARVFFYPAYTGINSVEEMNINDIAVVKIKDTIQFNEFQNKIELPISDIIHGDKAILAGWGMKSFPEEVPPAVLQKVSMTIFHNDFCRQNIPRTIYKHQFCAFNSLGTGPCSGDSGSPLVSNGRIVGIVSFNLPCALGLPDVYTRVYSYINFITDAMNS